MINPSNLSGTKRLFIFLLVFWLLIVVAFLLDSYRFNWPAFIAFGIFPIGIPWSIAWIVSGYREKKIT